MFDDCWLVFCRFAVVISWNFCFVVLHDMVYAFSCELGCGCCCLAIGVWVLLDEGFGGVSGTVCFDVGGGLGYFGCLVR